MKTKKKTQTEVILWMLQSEKLVTQNNFVKATRNKKAQLRTRISGLRKRGLKLDTKEVISKNGVFCYYELSPKNSKKSLKMFGFL